MNIELQSKLFRLRNILNSISDASFAYKTLYNRFRINEISDEEGRQLLKAYEDIIDQVRSSVQNTEYENKNSTHKVLE